MSSARASEVDPVPAQHLRVLAFVESYLRPEQTFVFRQMTGLPRSELRFAARYLLADCPYPAESVSFIGETRPMEVAPLRRRLRRAWAYVSGEYAHLSRRERARLATLFGALRPDIVHAHWGPDAMLIAPTCRAFRTPLIVQFHGYDASSLLTDRIYRRALHRLLDEAALGLTVSDDMKDRLVRLGFPAQKLRRHYIGVPDEFFASGPAVRAPAGKLRLLQVGRIAETKGHRTSLAAMARCMSTRVPVSLRIIGDGPLRRILEGEASRLGLADAVEFCGHAEPESVLAAMREADALLAPSETDAAGRREGLPMVVVEALAAGLPVLATAHAGIPEAVRYSEPGWLVAEGDSEALSERIMRLASDPALRARLGREGWALADQQFRLSAQCAGLESLYAVVLAPGAAQHS